MADETPLYFDVRLGALLDYNPESGVLTWKPRPTNLFASGRQAASHNCAIWNGRFAGRSALNCPDKRGYLTGHILGRPVKAHRAAWEIAYGRPPQGEIDHINGNPADNRLSNLREVSHAENGRNLKLKRTNSTGSCGVYQRPSGRWYARITYEGKAKNLGTFDTREQAIRAQLAASRSLGFHENHGTVR